MPWLLLLPGPQQPWCWLCRIGRSLSYLKRDFNYLCHVNVEEWHKMYISVFSPLKNFACKGSMIIFSCLYDPTYGKLCHASCDDLTTKLAHKSLARLQALTHWGRDIMAAISQTTFSSTFSWMKMFEFQLKFHWSLFLKVKWTKFQHWFR